MKNKKRNPLGFTNKVDETTKLSAIAPFLQYIKPNNAEEMKTAAEAKYGSPWGITIGNLLDCIGGRFDHIGVPDVNKTEEITVLQYYWMLLFSEMVEKLTATLENLAEPQSPEAKLASKGCVPVSFAEGILIYCRTYFGLQSFSAVRDLSLDDLLLAKKDSYNRSVFDHNISKLHEQKMSKK